MIVQGICKVCKKPFKRYRNNSRGQKPSFFCSLICYRQNIIKGKNHYLWKGESASYMTKHSWIRRNFGRPFKCENPKCFYPRRTTAIKEKYGKIMDKPKRYEWSNISGKYIRTREDWEMLCVSCHRKKDNITRKNLLNHPPSKLAV